MIRYKEAKTKANMARELKEIEQFDKTEGKQKVAYEKTQVVSQTAPAILDVRSGEAMSMEDALVEILNKIDRIERAVV